MNLVAAERTAGISNAGLNVGGLQKRILRQKIFPSVPSLQHSQNVIDRDPHAAYYGFAAKNLRV